ncbi:MULTISPECIES: prepilin-type N-terminal cleavage/methylation domain-containing protein [Thermus]|uniref:prepilin-type N-terminal cleavage/methylation domain-containing protein n=1 Tax=Thermus TaxID=270 RepID=UPI001F249292|nr:MULTISPECIES: prepilin-type N-terminal cleavage/methylation domain-containing protein [Thermus]
MRRAFTLLEVLLSLAILGLLLSAMLATTQSTLRLERTQRALALLSEELSLTAMVLAREASLAGYRLETGTPLVLSGSLLLRFLCDDGMEIYCSSESMGKVRTVGYAFRDGTLYWGTCTGEACAPTLNQPVMDGVEAFRLAYRSGGSWASGNLSVTLSQGGANPKVEALALYLAARSPWRTGARPFTPGSQVDWEKAPGLGRDLLLSGYSPPQDGHPRAERLVVVAMPNLVR